MRNAHLSSFYSAVVRDEFSSRLFRIQYPMRVHDLYPTNQALVFCLLYFLSNVLLLLKLFSILKAGRQQTFRIYHEDRNSIWFFLNAALQTGGRVCVPAIMFVRCFCVFTLPNKRNYVFNSYFYRIFMKILLRFSIIEESQRK